MKPKVWIQNIKFSDDSIVSFKENQITILVGPNNAGKSATLKELNHLTLQHKIEQKVVKDYSLQKEGTYEDLINYLKESSFVKYQGSSPDPYFQGYKFSIYGGGIGHQWSMPNILGTLQPIFVNLLSTEERLQISNPPGNISLTQDAVQHPIHFMQKDDRIEFKFSEYFKQAFNQDLIVHRNAGNIVPLYIGKRPTPKQGEDRASSGYVLELEKLAQLHEQGDGMRSFVGVLLSAFISNHNILLIDEPEAFLHPPQARLLGKMVAKDLPSDRQLFLATHSSDFLKGILDADSSNLKIIRIQRDGDINNITILEKEDITNLWNDSLLRHSNILDGLFHSKVIICEGDSDCRFYSAILQSLYEKDSNISPDYLFIHCGGKTRVPTVIKSLKKLDVKINTILDFDVLSEKSHIKDIFEESGGNWTLIENDWSIVKKAIDLKRPELETSDLKKEISKILDPTTEHIFPNEKSKAIRDLFKKTSAWSIAKYTGKSYIPSGDATKAYLRLSAQLEKFGILIVEVGELESFVRSVGNHGPKWVNEVLSKDLLNDTELYEAREFVKKIINS